MWGPLAGLCGNVGPSLVRSTDAQILAFCRGVTITANLAAADETQ